MSQLAQAFEAWEDGFRAEPAKYMTAEECAAAQVSDLSANRAAYFMGLLRATPGVQQCAHRRVNTYSFIEEDFVRRVCDDCGEQLSPESGDPPAAEVAQSPEPQRPVEAVAP